MSDKREGDKTPQNEDTKFFRDEYIQENKLEIEREQLEAKSWLQNSNVDQNEQESSNNKSATKKGSEEANFATQQYSGSDFTKTITYQSTNEDRKESNNQPANQNQLSNSNTNSIPKVGMPEIKGEEKAEAKHEESLSLPKARRTSSFSDIVRRVSISHLYNYPNIIQLEIDKMSKHHTIARIDHVLEYALNPKFIPIASPMMSTSLYCSFYGGQGFIPQDAFIYPLSTINYNITQGPEKKTDDLCFLKSGPRSQIYFNPKNVVAAIVTCGGLCPGLNVVIREITNTLFKNYGVSKVYGIQYGYRGFYTYNWIELTPMSTKHIHKLGGTILGSSRGGFDLMRIMKRIRSKGVNQIYIIGGDGTLKGGAELLNYVKKNKLEIVVASLPKTIDNDIPIIDRSFGYQTAVEEALHAINSAETEAMSAEYGIGLVKLMGRAAGHIALEACLSQRGVNILLIPEIKFEMNGPAGLLEYIFKRLLVKHHCVIVVAEGASEAVLDGNFPDLGTDPSGNKIFPDIGSYIKKAIVEYCAKKGLEATLKYIDPTYMIRTTASNAYDTQICAQLAYNSVHGAMSGFSGFCTGLVHNKTCYLPIDLLKQGNRRIQPKSRKWQRLLAATGQPSFINNEEMVAKDKFEARENLPSLENI